MVEILENVYDSQQVIWQGMTIDIMSSLIPLKWSNDEN
jgi:hypothetical protein